MPAKLVDCVLNCQHPGFEGRAAVDTILASTHTLTLIREPRTRGPNVNTRRPSRSRGSRGGRRGRDVRGRT